MVKHGIRPRASLDSARATVTLTTRIAAWNSALTSDMIFTQLVLYEVPLVTARTLLIIGQRDRTGFAGGAS